MSKKFFVDYEAIGDKIRQKRESLKLSQEVVAEKSDISPSFYGNIERGSRVISVDTLIKISNCLNLDLNYLFLEFLPKDDKEKFYAEIDNLFDGKTPAQSAFLLNMLKLLSNNTEQLLP